MMGPQIVMTPLLIVQIFILLIFLMLPFLAGINIVVYVKEIEFYQIVLVKMVIMIQA
jgi:acyl-CoA synthetase (AMP-forming)/AMP-acid ligase II